MERALRLATLALALGEHESLPSPRELQRLIAEAEVGLFIRQPRLSDEVLQAAWYLHGVASADRAQKIYSRERQRRAFQVSAHIFDLALADSDRPRIDRLTLAFGAQVGYRNGELNPNAMAVFSRMAQEISAAVPLVDHLDTVALEAGVALLGLDVRTLFRLLRRFRDEFAALGRQVGVPDLGETQFGPSAGVVAGADDLFRYLALGDSERLERAQAQLAAAARSDGGVRDLRAEWVAAHLHSIADAAGESSVWSVLPPDVPAAARRALTLTAPPVLTLWPPQVELLTREGGPNPLSADARRVVLAVPTSAGKTLIAQLLMVTHLAGDGGGVCYVAPMRSLAREVRRAMAGRMAVLRRRMGRDLPDFFGLLEEDDIPGIDTMTPERLAHLIHNDPLGVLARYSLFVFDEAHMLAEPGRGLALETVLSFLHWRTQTTRHRLVLLSAAFGNRGHLMSWLDPAGEGVEYSSEWRGPRRLHALFNAEVRDWTPVRTEMVRSADWPRREYLALRGIIRLRPAEAETTHLEFVEPVGELARRTDAEGRPKGGREGTHSTPGYRMAARVAAEIGHGGPVLIIMSSRVLARQMARAVADLHPETPTARSIADFVERRLGPNHPLTQVVPHGVSFHHSGLPTDVLEALEDGIRSGELQYIAATSTLTEGVNLPVRTVVLAETRYEGQPESAQLRGARLVNAMGRAGRATKESEGWIVLCRQAERRDTDFGLFAPGDDELEIQSRLASDEALRLLAEFEAAVSAGQDAVFDRAAHDVADFIGFVWFVLASEEELGKAVEAADVVGALESTLAFVQLGDSQKARWKAVAEQVRTAYAKTESATRRRWPRAGTSIGTARALDELASEIAARARERMDDNIANPTVALSVLAEVGAIRTLLGLPESDREWAFRPRQNAAASIAVDPDEALLAWVTGIDITDMADQLLADVSAADYRIEQMVDAVTEHFEHFLAWTLGVTVYRVNEMLESEEASARLCPDLPLFVRYGTASSFGLELAMAGVRSRRLRQAIADQAAAAHVETLEDWLAEMSVADWRARFEASAADLRDLLEYTRAAPADSFLPDLFEQGQASVPVQLRAEPADDLLEIRAFADEESPSRLGVFGKRGELVAVIPPRSHADIQALLDTGLELGVRMQEQRLLVEVDL